MSVPVLDPDLQELWNGSTVLDYRQEILRTQAIRDNTAAITAQMATRTALIDKGVGALMDTAGTSKDDLIERIYMNMVEAYMRPATTSLSQSEESMIAEADADAKRLRLAAYRVFDQIRQSKEAW